MMGPGMAPFARAALQTFLRHTYSRVPVTITDHAQDNSDVESKGAAVAGIRCHYQPTQALVQNAQGDHTEDNPTILIAWDDTLAINDVVRDVIDFAGTSLLPGDNVVTSIEPYAGFGPNTFKLVRFAQGRTA